MKKTQLKRYVMFPDHGDEQSKRYHSPHLPLPNVVRIEVLSPKARMRYLGEFHKFTEGFRQSIIEQMALHDCSAPFYGFFDPKTNGDLGFDVSSEWSNQEHTGLDSITSVIQNLGAPGQFVAGTVNTAKDIVSKGLDLMGIDNESTGSNTMKTFRKADFNFTKTIKCSWYMPEQENMARVSIARLLNMAFVKNFDTAKLTGQYASKIADIVKKCYTEAFNKDGQSNTGAQTAGEATTTPEQQAAKEQSVLGKVGAVFSGIADGAAELGGEMLNSGLVNTVIDNMVSLGLATNEFFGGSLTLNPLPVRLTLGHQLDIEPLVITNVKFSGSQEQFMTTDGSNIPLFVSAEISFAMWMVPDPNKGFIRYLGDDLFSMSYVNGRSVKDGSLDKKKSTQKPIKNNKATSPSEEYVKMVDSSPLAGQWTFNPYPQKTAKTETPSPMVLKDGAMVMREYPAPNTGKTVQDQYSYTSPIY